MSKEMILNKEEINRAQKSVSFSALLSPVLYVIDMLARYYSFVLDEKYTRRSTLLLLHTQVAFTFAAFPVDCSFLLRVVFILWFVASMKLFRKYR